MRKRRPQQLIEVKKHERGFAVGLSTSLGCAQEISNRFSINVALVWVAHLTNPNSEDFVGIMVKAIRTVSAQRVGIDNITDIGR
jgi:hypothetical protein